MSDVGEHTLICAAGRVEVAIRPDGSVEWALARDQIGSFATVPSLRGDAVDWPIEVGAVPALRIERRGQIAGETVHRASKPTLPKAWRVLRIRPLPPYLPGERFSDGRLVKCWHQHAHEAASCSCICACCLEQHVERLDAFEGRRVTVRTLNSVYAFDGAGGAVRTPDGENARAQVMLGAAAQVPIVLGEAFFVMFDGSVRRSSAVQAIVIE